MIHIPSQLPDELAHGFVERIRIVNGFPTQELTIRLLTTWLNEAQGVPKNQPLVVRLAAALGISQMAFIRHHTLLPIHRAVTGSNAHHLHGDPTDSAILIRSGMRLARTGTYSCPECINEDFSYWGHTYWRRSHQLPGIDWCLKHKTRLHLSHTSAFDMLPGDSKIEFLPIAAASYSELDHVDVCRYVDILHGFLERQKPFNLPAVSQALVRRARELDIRMAPKGTRPTLSSLALERLPENWLKRHFPSINRSRTAKHQTFDGVFLSKTSAHASTYYALAAALLFPSAEEAINSMAMPVAPLPQAKKTKIKRPSGFWGSTELLESYAAHNGNVKSLTRTIGGDYTHVRSALKNNGLPPLANVTPATLQAVQDFLRGAEITEILKMPDIHVDIFFELIRTAGARFANALKLMNGDQKAFELPAHHPEAPTPKSDNRKELLIPTIDKSYEANICTA